VWESVLISIGIGNRQERKKKQREKRERKKEEK
jgi:hypothetical protein